MRTSQNGFALAWFVRAIHACQKARDDERNVDELEPNGYSRLLGDMKEAMVAIGELSEDLSP